MKIQGIQEKFALRWYGMLEISNQFLKPYRSNDSLYKFLGGSEISPSCQQGLHIFQMSIKANWTQKAIVLNMGGWKFLQYGTGCTGKCSEVTESTVPYLLNTNLKGSWKLCFWLKSQTSTLCPFRHGTYAEPISKQSDLVRSERILNQSDLLLWPDFFLKVC